MLAPPNWATRWVVELKVGEPVGGEVNSISFAHGRARRCKGSELVDTTKMNNSLDAAINIPDMLAKYPVAPVAGEVNGKKYASHLVRLYYEDCDHSGACYHPNYLKYYERAREHTLNPDLLAKLWEDHGLGFVVTKCDLQFKVSLGSPSHGFARNGTDPICPGSWPLRQRAGDPHDAVPFVQVPHDV